MPRNDEAFEGSSHVDPSDLVKEEREREQAERECIEPNGSAFDCPVHDPRKLESEAVDARLYDIARRAYLLGARAEKNRGGNPLPALDMNELLKKGS